MIAFEVYVNEVKVCTAGLGDLDAVIEMLMCRVKPNGRPGEHRTLFTVSGVSKDKEKAYQWLSYDLEVGNRVEIRVVNAKTSDAPKELGCQGGSGAG